MKSLRKDAVVIGAGPAGMAAAIALKEEGIDRVLLLEREECAGGILNQCIHDGFGLVAFDRNYTGPEYADIYIKRLRDSGVEILTGVMVTEIRMAGSGGGNDGADAGKADTEGICEKKIVARTRSGEVVYNAKSVILATGCREKPRGAMAIPGSRPAGIYTAGTAQNFVNLQNLLPGTKAVILGSGDIGLIMARRLTLEGIDVLAVIEKEKTPGGLPRNVIQCLKDFDIPLVTGATVTNIFGRSRLTGIEVSDIAEDGSVLTGSGRIYGCDTLILSVGLIPENEVGSAAGMLLDDRSGLPVTDDDGLTNLEGVYVCGNALFVHDLVDDVSLEGEHAGRCAAAWLKAGGAQNTGPARKSWSIDGQKQKMEGRRKSSGADSVICILCPNSCEITYDLKGAMCGKGLDYVRKEFLSPERTLTTSVKVINGERPLTSVRTSEAIPRELLREAMRMIGTIAIEAPVEVGQVIRSDFMKVGVDLLSTCNIKKSMASSEPL